MRLPLLPSAGLVLILVLAPVLLPGAEADRFRDEVRPILAELCFDCHGPEKAKGDLRLDTLGPESDPEIWHDILDQLHLGEMPPPKEAQPGAAERSLLVDWIRLTLREAAEAKRFAEGRVRTRRLTRYEYANTVRDLLGIELVDPGRELPPEPASPAGFLNDGAVLEVAPSQVETYLRAARHALEVALVEGEEAPLHHRWQATETAVGRLPNKKVAGHLPANPEFALDIRDFPREGEFVLRVRARAVLPPGRERDLPRLRASLGCVPGIIHVPRRPVGGEVEVTAEPETYVFRGRIEDYPQPGDVPFKNLNFQGMIAMLDFLDADGKELRYPDRVYVVPPPKPKKGQKKPSAPPPVPVGSQLDIVIESVEFEAPVHASWPPPSHRRLVFGAEGESMSLHDVFRRFMEWAWRRPVTEDEVDGLVRLHARIRPASASDVAAIRECLAAVLVSPHFLHRVETGRSELAGFELAGKLSYFLWRTMPDEQLFDLARTGRLSDPRVLERETIRLLEDPRAEAFVTRFVGQWLGLDGLDRVAVDAKRFPGFEEGLKADMRREVTSVFQALLLNDLSALRLIDSDWTLLNRALARHYGLEGPRSARFEFVALPPDSPRGGLLGHGAFLLAGSNGAASHPIKRAVWILDRLLDSPPAPPPADTPELDPANPGLAGLSLKQQLEVHRDKEACANCHRGIDPWGIPLESFDAVGRWRTVNADRTGSEMPDGTMIGGVDALKQYLLEERSEWFARALVKRLGAYALGRSLDLGDRAVVEALTAACIADDFRLKSLIVRLVQSEWFLPPQPPTTSP